jgi:hydrogenase nickel incorporation protein HypA/HybF
MHELAIASSIVELAAEASRGHRVTRVNLEVGKLSGVVMEALAFCFPEVARGTSVETADLAITEIEGVARREACGQEFATPDMLTTCCCGSLRFERLAGEELNLKSIEIDEDA